MFGFGDSTLRDDSLDILLPVLKCLKCSGTKWDVQLGADGSTKVVCTTCHQTSQFQNGILWANAPTVHEDVTSERNAVKPSEHVPELGGWSESYRGVGFTDTDLVEAYMSLPYGDGSSRFTQPGYFAGVSRFSEEFDFISSQLPSRGSLLDLGADGTWSTARLAARGLTCTALDITDHLALGDLYQTRYPSYARINVDMHEDAFVDASFDAITAFNALHHSRRLNVVAARIAAALKPGGTLGFVEPYVQNAEQERAFGAPQAGIGISENLHTIQEWHRTFHEVGLTLKTFAMSDAFCAVYEKPARNLAESLDVLSTDPDGCIVEYYRGKLESTPTDLRFVMGETPVFQVKVTNHSRAAWASRGPKPVNLGYHVERLDGDGFKMVAFDGPRTAIASFLAGGESRIFAVPVPLCTAGVYRIEFDLVHETKTWFRDRGATTATVICTIT